MRFLRGRIELVCLLAILALLVVPKKRASDRHVLAQTLTEGLSASIPVTRAQDPQSELPKIAIESVPWADERLRHSVEVCAPSADWVMKNVVALTENPQDFAASANVLGFDKLVPSLDARAVLVHRRGL
jgi:hypothetical protein